MHVNVCVMCMFEMGESCAIIIIPMDMPKDKEKRKKGVKTGSRFLFLLQNHVFTN